MHDHRAMSGLKSAGKKLSTSNIHTAHDPLQDSAPGLAVIENTELNSQAVIDSDMIHHANIGTSAISSDIGRDSEVVGRLTRFSRIGNEN